MTFRNPDRPFLFEEENGYLVVKDKGPPRLRAFHFIPVPLEAQKGRRQRVGFAGFSHGKSANNGYGQGRTCPLISKG